MKWSATLNLLIFNIIKNKFLKEEKENFKKVVQKKMLEDSKALGLAAFAVNLASVGIVMAIPTLVYSTLAIYDYNQEQSLLISAAVLLTLSIITFLVAVKFFKDKIEIYKNVSNIKSNVTDFTWLDPLTNQFKLEHNSLKAKIANNT